MKEIYIYTTIDGWIKDEPFTTINGEVKSKEGSFIEIADENGFTQVINMERVFAIVY